MSTQREKLSRRTFLARASAGAAALSSAAVIRGAVGANERLSVGVIGTGDRGRQAMIAEIIALAESHNAAVTAVCDVWRVNLEAAATQVEQAFGRRPSTTTRFNELLDADVDAVMIATADFSHSPIMIEAIKAGKDVYCEKPMSITMDEANEALDLARARSAVVQIGTQYRSYPPYWAGRDYLTTGELGDVTRISAAIHFNHARWLRNYNDCHEQDVDWQAYLSGRPFDPKLLRRWHLYKTCTNGLSGLWGCHYVDAMHVLTGAQYPRRAAALGSTYHWKEDREHSDVFHALWDYPEGFQFDWSMSLTSTQGRHWRVHGTKGTLTANNSLLDPAHWVVVPEPGSGLERRNIEPAPVQSTGNLTRDHVANWLDCIRSRQQPTADIIYGHQHSVATIMAAASLHEGRTYVYDPQSRSIRPA